MAKTTNFISLLGLAILILPSCAWATEQTSPPAQLDLTQHWVGYFSLLVMVSAYVAAMFEDVTSLRKSKPMLLAAGLIWVAIVFVYQQHGDVQPAVAMFRSNLLTYVELLLFIMVSMTYLNIMDNMQVFAALRVWLSSRGLNYRQLFWVTGLLVFFMSFFLNGLTTALLMGSVVMAVGKNNPRFVSVACINIVVAANAGGSVSPLGGISTLFVWQHGMLKFTDFFNLFGPCLINFLVPAVIMQFAVAKEYPAVTIETIYMQRGAKVVMVLFAATISLAVGVDMLLHMPAVLGMMMGLSLLNLFNYYLQKSPKELKRSPEQLFKNLANTDLSFGVARYQNYNVTEEVGDLDWDTLLFFYGAMMGIGGLGYIGYLDAISHILYGQLSPTIANIVIGLSSAFVDNGTLMFAVLTMHPDIPQGQWLLLTLTLGVGGSLLAIGSAPGIGLLGLSKGRYSFTDHLKWFPVILLGYFASIGVLYLLNSNYF
ncbi:MAG: sodium:proton antiporter NhaD [Methylococcales bacterium]